MTILWNISKRVLVLAAVVAATGIVVAAVCCLVTGEAKFTVGIVIALLGIGVLAWGVKSFSVYRLSFARTFMVVLILGLFVLPSAAYLDIGSPTDIKDSLVAALHGDSEQFRTSVDTIVGRAELGIVELVSSSGDEAEQGTEGTTEFFDTEYVSINGGILIGADGHRILLRNNPNGENPTWKQLKTFLADDRTDERPYDPSMFVCADFAEMLHNNAESAGIRAAYVCVQLGPCSYFPASGHALNAFETVDKGLVYIDCTGYLGDGPTNCDKIVNISVGKHYIPQSIFPEPRWSTTWGDMGLVREVEVVQW